MYLSIDTIKKTILRHNVKVAIADAKNKILIFLHTFHTFTARKHIIVCLVKLCFLGLWRVRQQLVIYYIKQHSAHRTEPSYSNVRSKYVVMYLGKICLLSIVQYQYRDITFQDYEQVSGYPVYRYYSLHDIIRIESVL